MRSKERVKGLEAEWAISGLKAGFFSSGGDFPQFWPCFAGFGQFGALVYNRCFAPNFYGANRKMIRFLQTQGRVQRVLLVGFLSIVCIMMVVTLVPGGFLGGFGGRGVGAKAVAKVDGQDVTNQEVDMVARNMMQQRHIPEQFKAYILPQA